MVNIFSFFQYSVPCVRFRNAGFVEHFLTDGGHPAFSFPRLKPEATKSVAAKRLKTSLPVSRYRNLISMGLVPRSSASKEVLFCLIPRQLCCEVVHQTEQIFGVTLAPSPFAKSPPLSYQYHGWSFTRTMPVVPSAPRIVRPPSQLSARAFE